MNFGVDISVKVHSLFLLFLAFLILTPEASRFFHIFFRPDVPYQGRRRFFPLPPSPLRTVTKGIIIFLLLFDTLAPYVLVLTLF
ncbi:MAG: hypothetical protein AB7H80_15915 [Candidatus Kapaibacterium sp.]